MSVRKEIGLNEPLKQRLETYRLHRGLIIDVLRELSDEQLGLTIGNGMGTLGKQFKHIGRIQLCYLEALKTKKMSFWKPIGDPSLERSRERLLRFLDEGDTEMIRFLEGLTDEQIQNTRIDWRGKAHQSKEVLSLYDHLDDLILHEVLHEGEFIVYMRSLGLSFPSSWKLWGFSRRSTP